MILLETGNSFRAELYIKAHICGEGPNIPPGENPFQQNTTSPRYRPQTIPNQPTNHNKTSVKQSSRQMLAQEDTPSTDFMTDNPPHTVPHRQPPSG
ncbi:hypothetical protein DSO57_1005236 [Entomophthora muscae]|uniref:Uncharacterized protein n=1 Tax=Entomophthora muscae TaxID=34485 RepID=A0ACC2U617_9FUNG|nr:hypothetical protein DSO57_1005236 [Entomophthora muscae]